ncbi:hypothetical protein BJ322DRAFT_1108801 [Thelephora terrestris]|uniref:Uncharacterized protein n=1 Tax=Thelephora terrestris TaxID=56493 RepID=A0A9P6HEY4_9AGAM|nr:hypothetical protein BJ322DRAFT_1114208 [Thelephora terrestris]KAF9785356.1 hypothetical protein BJ322DRAFT_1108801 [Thelephora terrestris]
MQNSRTTGSPALFEARIALSSRATPVTPTPRRVRGGDDLLRSPISAREFSSKKSRRDDSIFSEYKAILRRATTLVTFEWDAQTSKGALVPIPYPLDENGSPVEPSHLPQFLQTHDWDRPSCFCVMRGSPRKAQFLVPTWRESASFDMMCLVCPESDCSYFVNVVELMSNYRDQVLSVRDAGASESDSATSSSGITAEAVPKKRKRNLRQRAPDVKGKSASLNVASSSSRPKSHPNDCPSAGVASTVSNLLSRHGVLQEQFYKAFRVCDYCRRIVCNETSQIDGHVCVIEVED